jgi:hypothetical protein
MMRKYVPAISGSLHMSPVDIVISLYIMYVITSLDSDCIEEGSTTHTYMMYWPTDFEKEWE